MITNLRAFDDYVPQSEWYVAHKLVEACEYIQTLGQGYEVRLYSTRWGVGHPTYRWLLPDTHSIDGSAEFGGDGTVSSGGELNGETVFLLIDVYLKRGLQAEIEAVHPKGRWHTQADDKGETAFAAYVIGEP